MMTGIPVTGDVGELIERISAWLWVLVALAGLVLRVRRLWILSHLTYTDEKDQRYLRTVIGSSILRGIVKLILCFGGVLAVWSDPTVPLGAMEPLFWLWRGGVITALVLLLIEDVRVDVTRRYLGERESVRRGGAA
jgi:uncharacterized membrane protein